MQSQPQRDWLQIVALFGVVASLIFVGLQMKQDQDIALSAAYQARTAALNEFLIATATDEVVRSSMMKSMNSRNNNSDLTPDESFAFFQMMSAGIALMENSQFQYVNGYLDDEHWQSIRQLIKRQIQIPAWRERILSDEVRPSFRRAVEEIDRELSAESGK